LIQKALENAASAIAADDTVEVEPVVDRDTLNVPGSPDISATIFAKIVASDVFVADVSIVTRAEGMRPTPNPNVLIELGYGFKALGHDRVILVFNVSFGRVEELPFDLRSRRVLTYDMSKDAPERAGERKKLEAQFDQALRSALAQVPAAQPAPIPVVHAIETVQPNRAIVLRRALDDLLRLLDGLEPPKHRDGGTIEQLMEAISRTQRPVAEYSKIAEAIAVMDDASAAVDVCRWFGRLFERYNLPADFNGRFSEADHDYFRFIGHEMFVTLVALLLRERRWETLHRALDEPISMNYLVNRGAGNVEWDYASEHVSLLGVESQKRGRISLHADILRERHLSGGLAAILPFDQFLDADFFLFLQGQRLAARRSGEWRYWRSWSSIFLRQAPTFLRDAEKKRIAEPIVRVLDMASIEELKQFVADEGPKIMDLYRGTGASAMDYPNFKDIAAKIGTR
jgi:hypothetical protein